MSNVKTLVKVNGEEAAAGGTRFFDFSVILLDSRGSTTVTVVVGGR